MQKYDMRYYKKLQITTAKEDDCEVEGDGVNVIMTYWCTEAE